MFCAMLCLACLASFSAVASALLFAECVESSATECAVAATAFSSRVVLPIASEAITDWPPGVLAIDVDVLQRNTSIPYLRALYDGFPAQRAAISMDLPLHVPIGSYSAAAQTRPTDVQLQQSCALLQTIFPALPLQPCNSKSRFDLDISGVAIQPPASLRRDGTLSSSTFEDVAALSHYSPASSVDAVESYERLVVAAMTGAAEITRDVDTNIDCVGTHCVSLPQALAALVWGGGGLAHTARSVNSSRIVTAVAALDTAPRGADSLGLLSSILVAGRFVPPQASSGAILALHAQLTAEASAASREVGETALLFPSSAWHHGGVHLSLIPVFAAAPATGGSSASALAHPRVVAVHVVYTETGVVVGSDAVRALAQRIGAPTHKRTLATSQVGLGSEVRRGLLFASYRGHLLQQQQQQLAHVATDSNAAPLSLSGSVCRSLRSTGLHRELTYRVHATARVPRAWLAAAATYGDSIGGGSSKCQLALVQRLEAATYFDLDEVRDAQRKGAAAAAIAAGPAGGAIQVPPLQLRAFARYIDVERPASASTQHLVALAVPLRQGGGSSGAPAPQQQQLHTAQLSVLQPPRGLEWEGDEEAVLRIAANLSLLLHLRYQATGCGAEDASSIPQHADGRTAWVDAMRGVWGPLHADGSASLAAKEKATVGINPATGAPFDVNVSWPYTAGCYRFAHLPLPTLHLRCSGGGGDSAGDGGQGEPPGLAALAAALRTGGEGDWVTVPLEPRASSAVPFQPGFDDSCTPLLAPVPVGDRDHLLPVSAITAATSLACAALLVTAAAVSVFASPALHPLGAQTAASLVQPSVPTVGGRRRTAGSSAPAAASAGTEVVPSPRHRSRSRASSRRGVVPSPSAARHRSRF